MRTARAGIGQRSAGMTTPSDWAGDTAWSDDAIGGSFGEGEGRNPGTPRNGGTRS